MNLSTSLNPLQLKAVLHTEGSLLVLAGAGSGKTRVITHRVAHLISNKGVAPYNILAITFTNKAAQEMKERISTLLEGRCKGVWASTFHSLCVRILHQHIEKVGYMKEFVIYGTAEQASLVKECLKHLRLDDKLYTPKSFLWKISSLKNELITVEDLRSGKKELGFSDEHLISVYALYQKRLKENNALDFDDLILLTVQLLRKDRTVQEYYSNLFKYIMVDEYQDTNHAQYWLVKLLVGETESFNICVVGDDDQSIYRWRGATVDHIFTFEHDYPHTEVITLEENYRSVQNILNAANTVIEKNSRRKKKRLWTKNDEGEKLEYHRLEDESDEADFISRTIQSLCEDGYGYNDFAIFYRINAQSRIIEDRLIRKGVPYQVIGGPKFYERKEIKDLLAYLKVIVNPNDSVSLKRIINVPRRGIGAVTLNKMVDYSSSHGLSLFQGIREMLSHNLFQGKVRVRLESFVPLLEEMMIKMKTFPVSCLIEAIIDSINYKEELKTQNPLQTEERINNIQELITAAKNFEENEEGATISGFLDSTSLIADIDTLEENAGSVTLMTFHASKGLEFSVVFMVGMENNLFPHRSAFYDVAEMEEERRLCYVGMTRAKKRLFISNAVRRKIYNKEQENQPSLFIGDIPDELIKQSSAQKESLFFDQRTPASPYKRQFASNSSKGEFAVGRRVSHPHWGVGTIKNTDGYDDNIKVTVLFPGVGQKKLAVKHASLTIVRN